MGNQFGRKKRGEEPTMEMPTQAPATGVRRRMALHKCINENCSQCMQQFQDLHGDGGNENGTEGFGYQLQNNQLLILIVVLVAIFLFSISCRARA